MMRQVMQLRAKTKADNTALAAAWTERYGGVTIVSRGREHMALELEGLVVEANGAILGALTFHREGDEIEVVTLDSFSENKGAGTALLAAAADLARHEGARRLWLVTSNDNIRAIRFYQRRGWEMVALYRNAIVEARKIKPEIPIIGDNGIAICHEIEFELRLS